MLKKRLARLEQAVFQKDNYGVYFVEQQHDHMKISGLNFAGTIDGGHQLMQKYPRCTFIIDDIPHQEELT